MIIIIIIISSDSILFIAQNCYLLSESQQDSHRTESVHRRSCEGRMPQSCIQTYGYCVDKSHQGEEGRRLWLWSPNKGKDHSITVKLCENPCSYLVTAIEGIAVTDVMLQEF